LVSERFSTLGKRFKEHYQQPNIGEPPQPPDDELKQALRTLGDALDRAFSAVGSALRDPEVRDRAKEAANALVSAFGNTFADVGDELGKTFRRRDEGQEAAGESGSSS
jgi:hypothetical protein